MSRITPWSTRSAAAAALAVIIMTSTSPADAGPAVPALVQTYIADARVAGQGRLTWLGFHVYDAALYVPAGFAPARAEAASFVLELTYARRLSGLAIAERSRDEIERLGYGTPEQRARWFEQMRAVFPDVEKGRKLAGVNVPGAGARFYFEGRFIGAIDDPAFARAFFGIWFDPRTAAPQLRDNLLKQAAGGGAAGA
jgi:hypothetical protein